MTESERKCLDIAAAYLFVFLAHADLYHISGLTLYIKNSEISKDCIHDLVSDEV